MLTFLEGQALQKRDCPSKIGTVDNYEIKLQMWKQTFQLFYQVEMGNAILCYLFR